jgi:hypothetical protein
MVERFNRRLAEAIRSQPAGGNGGKNKFATHEQRDAFLCAFIESYNKTRLRCLNYKAPEDKLANLTGHNTCARMPESGRG